MSYWLTRSKAPHQLDDQALTSEVLDLRKGGQKFGLQGCDSFALFVGNCRSGCRKELRYWNVQSFGEPAETLNAGEHAGMLNLVKARLGDVSSVGELRLRKSVLDAQLTDLAADPFSNS